VDIVGSDSDLHATILPLSLGPRAWSCVRLRTFSANCLGHQHPVAGGMRHTDDLRMRAVGQL
jgi:hypothetical protein